MTIINSLTNNVIVEACKLKLKKYRDERKLFLIEGLHLLSMAINIVTIFTTNTSYTNNEVEVIYVSDKVMEKLSINKSAPEYIAICSYLKEKINGKKILVLDNIQDPGNLGTIIRSSLAFNVDSILLSNDTVDIYNPKVIAASQGAIFNITFKREDLYSYLKDKDNIIVSTLASDSIPLKEFKKLDSYYLVMGNEGNGVSKKIIDIAKYKIKIEQSPLIDSLNVGVATSIILYYFELI